MKLLMTGCVWLAAAAVASPIYVGSNGDSPIQIFENGSVSGTFGGSGSSAVASDGTAHWYVLTPDSSGNATSVAVLDSNLNLLRTINFGPGLDNGNGSPGFLTDTAYGPSGTLFVSGYNGIIYDLDVMTGQILSSFDTGSPFTGVATDGTNLFTTSGAGLNGPASIVYRRDLSGNIVDAIDTGLRATLGVAYDSSSQTLWVGGFDTLTQVGLDGSILASYDVPGTHTGVEAVEAPTVVPVPEPSSAALMLGGGILLFALRTPLLRRHRHVLRTVVALGIPAAMFGAVTITSLTPSAPDGQPVGTPVKWTVSASDSEGTPHILYRFRFRASGSATFGTIVDYGPQATLNYVPAEREGTYEIEATARNVANGTVDTRVAAYTYSSRVTGGSAVVSPTSNPLVALYSAPPCPVGGVMRVRFKRSGDIYDTNTRTKPCNGTSSMNFWIAGMYGNTTYTMKHDVISGPRIGTSAPITFTTGTPQFSLPGFRQSVAPKPPSSTLDPVLFEVPVVFSAQPYATDLSGNLIWYYPYYTLGGAVRPEPGGNVVLAYGDPLSPEQSGMREIDLVGNTLKETNMARLNEQLAALGGPHVNSIHHEARRLPSGQFLMLTQTERLDTPQGAGVDVLGDVILVLDADLQVQWFWNSFDKLDVSRRAVLGETCTGGSAACTLLKASVANDWTHGNSVGLTPDGNILYSSRHQDMVYKIQYANGTGNGDVIWRLGKGGDFTYTNTSDPWPWSSHQHDVEYTAGTSNVISLFDNGNTRVTQSGGHSRGQVLQVDEQNRTVSLLLNQDLGVFSIALGSAQRLTSGSYEFDAGWIPATNSTSQSEYSLSGTQISKLDIDAILYRVYRSPDMYSALW